MIVHNIPFGSRFLEFCMDRTLNLPTTHCDVRHQGDTLDCGLHAMKNMYSLLLEIEAQAAMTSVSSSDAPLHIRKNRLNEGEPSCNWDFTTWRRHMQDVINSFHAEGEDWLSSHTNDVRTNITVISVESSKKDGAKDEDPRKSESYATAGSAEESWENAEDFKSACSKHLSR